MVLLNELAQRRSLYLERAVTSDHKGNATVDRVEHFAWKKIAAAWRSLATQAEQETQLLSETARHFCGHARRQAARDSAENMSTLGPAAQDAACLDATAGDSERKRGRREL
jgi:hypothetical protein